MRRWRCAIEFAAALLAIFHCATLSDLYAGDCGDSFTVAENGVLESDIVIPEKALDCERFAADELKYHIDKAFGVSISIIGENELSLSKLPYHFFIGATKSAKDSGIPGRMLAADEHIVRTSGRGLYLIGCDSAVKYNDIFRSLNSPTIYATVYAVYDFLETEMGVKWIWPGPTGEVIPKRKSLTLGKIDRTFREPLEDRTFYGMNWSGWDKLGFSSMSAKRAFFDAQGKFLLRHRAGRRHRYISGHAFNKWWDRFGKSNPEYFNMLPGGVRRPASAPRLVTMCVSQPKVWKQIVADWRDWWNGKGSKRGYEPWVNCCENDYMALCQCPECRSWDAPDPRFAQSSYWNGTMTLADIDGYKKIGNFWMLSLMTDHRWGIMKVDTTKRPVASVADRYAKYYNAVQEEVRKTDPQARVIGYAYENYLEGPKETKVDPSVIIEYVPRSYFPYDEEESRYFRKTWMQWRNAGAKDMILRPNYMLAGGNYPFDQGRCLLDDFAFAFTNGMKSCTYDSLRGSWSGHAMMTYSLIRAFREPLRDPLKSREDILDAFGPARNAVEKYFDAVRENTVRWTYETVREMAWKNPMGNHNGGGSFNSGEAILGEFFEDDFFVKGYAVLDEAVGAASGDAEIIARIEFLRKGLKETELTRRTRVAQKAMKAAPADEEKKAAFLAAFKELKAYRRIVEPDFISSYDFNSHYEKNMGWPH